MLTPGNVFFLLFFDFFVKKTDRMHYAYSLFFFRFGLFFSVGNSLSSGSEDPFFLNKISYNKKNCVNNYVYYCSNPRCHSS